MKPTTLKMRRFEKVNKLINNLFDLKKNFESCEFGATEVAKDKSIGKDNIELLKAVSTIAKYSTKQVTSLYKKLESLI
jgi:hypothetical protein|tara:strand:+ start:947 stop:1180 length:234 start_codon:yes stop_codon:yes gene_type:complete